MGTRRADGEASDDAGPRERVDATVYVVLPGGVDDPATPSGGNVYDRRICRGLPATGWSVREAAVPGAWPRPDAVARAELDRSLDAIPDGAVVLADGLVACGVPEIMAAHAGRLRLAVLVHLPLADETGLAPDEAADLDRRERATLHAAYAVVATSPWAARRLVDHHGLEPSRVHAVTPGTDPAPLSPGSDAGSGTGAGAFELLCVASVTPRKGQDLLVEALATIPELPWTCVCVGTPPRETAYVAGLRQAIERYGLADRVRLTGPRTGERLAASYAAADLMVLASRAETYGMVVTEALARGIPVLATDVDAVPETLGRDPGGGVPGMLVPPDDPAALAAALRRWLTEPDLRRRIKDSARRRRGSLAGWEATSRQMSGVLERLRGEPR